MSLNSKRRSMTFTGCWTCKRRKVKCDERPSSCGNCSHMGLVCGGYAIKLQWMTDPYGEPRKSDFQNKGRVRIAHNSGPAYRMADIESFLVSLEDDAATELSSQKGPFTYFLGYNVKPPKKSFLTCPSGLYPAERTTSCTETDKETTNSPESATDLSSPLPSNGQPLPMEFGDFHHSSNGEAGRTTDPELIQSDDDTEDLIRVIDARSTPVHPGSLSRSGTFPGAQTPNFFGITLDGTSIGPTGNTAVDRLLHNYVIHVADLLQPVQHPCNPYRTLYFPAALQASDLRSHAHAHPTTQVVQSVLLHSLLASSAFHLWNCDSSNIKYHKIGSQHRQRALYLLQLALNSSFPAPEYKTLMMAILSLVTIDVMSACEADFTVHLRAAMQLRQSRRHWKFLSKATQRLNEIGAFLFLLARTVSFSPKSMQWIQATVGSSDEDSPLGEGSDCCFTYMYGITPMIAEAILETCRLAEQISIYERTKIPIPDSLSEACEILGGRLLSWYLEYETPSSITTEDDDALAIFTNHAKAWHLAALVYYYRRIQGIDNKHESYTCAIERIAEYMHAVEDIKASSSPGISLEMAPITWPALIASCEATFRQPWELWWNRVQCYRIANIQRQWEVVQMIWQKKDQMKQAGLEEPDWITIFQSQECTLLPI